MEENGKPEAESASAGINERETNVELDNAIVACPPVLEINEQEGDNDDDFSCNDVDQAAVLQLTFDSIDDAEKFYIAYASLAGFRVRTQSVKTKNGELIKNKEWVCTREGFRKAPKESYYRKRGPRPETRCGCRASFRVAHDRFSGNYIVTRFEPNHNHPLEPCKKSSLSASDKSMLTLMTDAGFRPCQAMNFLEHLAGGPGKLSFKRKDGYNYLHKIRSEKNRGGDTETESPSSLMNETSDTDTRDLKRKLQDEENSSEKLNAPGTLNPNSSSLKRMKNAKSNALSIPANYGIPGNTVPPNQRVDASTTPHKDLKLEHRTSLRKMVEINRRIQKSQVDAIEELGFGSMIRIQFDQIDRMLVRWLLECYNPDTSCLSIHGYNLTVDDEAVHRTLGIPKAGIKPALCTTSSEGLTKYETMFGAVEGRIDLSDLYEKLKRHDGCGEEFKVMYMTLVLGAVLFPCIHQNLPVHYLDLLLDLRMVKHINWAGLVRESINNGVRLWKEKATAYVAGCLLFFQVFFFARVRPQGSPHFIRLNCEIPFVSYLTRQRVTLLTTDMQRKGGYLNPKACCLEEPKNPYYCPITLIQAKDPREHIVPVQFYERIPYAIPVGVEKVALPRYFGKSKGTGEEDKRAVERGPTKDQAGATGVVQLDQGMTSSTPPSDIGTSEKLQSNKNVQPDAKCNRNSVGATGATNVDRAKDTGNSGAERSSPPSTEGADFLLQSQVTLLSARVLALETQCGQLMNILNELLSRQMGNGGNPSCPPVGPLSNAVTTFQECTTNVPRPINSTLNATLPETIKHYFGQSVTTPPPLVSSKLGSESRPSSANSASREDEGDCGQTSLANRVQNSLPKFPVPDPTHQLEADLDHPPEKAADHFHFQMQRKSLVVKASCPMSPMAYEHEIIQFLLDKSRDLCEFIVDFGFYHANRSNIMCLSPDTFLNGTVIDCFAYWCTLETRVENPIFTPRWYFSAMFSQMILKDHFSDDKIIKTFFKGDHKLTNDIRRCQQLYIPINDLHQHWFSCIVDFAAKKVYICDTAHVEEMGQYRKRIVDKMIDRLEHVLRIWKPNDFKFRNIRGTFKYEYPDWVPKQKNGWDCGLHVCLMMKPDLIAQKELNEDTSAHARRQIALRLYRSTANRFAWEET